MRKTRWGASAALMQVCTDSRDLGAHISFSARLAACTIKARFRRAIDVVGRIGSFPMEKAERLKLITMKVMPMTLYGCESTPTPAALAKSLSHHIKVALPPRHSECFQSPFVCHDLGSELTLSDVACDAQAYQYVP